MILLQVLGLILLAIVVAGIILRLLHPLPPLEPRPQSVDMGDGADTRLGRATRPRAAAHPGMSGVHTLEDAHQAFAARIMLARTAERTLDVQYYIWHDDLSGTLLLTALRDAADRGVRVRLLLDDNGATGLDRLLAAFDRHPMIEVRLFNPFVIRRPKQIGYMLDFFRLNRRMHNKSFTADNSATIIGGRNIGDEYFGAQTGPLFADLDVLAIGPVVDDTSRDFERYWQSGSAYAARTILSRVRPMASWEIAERRQRIERDPRAREYMRIIHELPFLTDMTEGRLAFEWAPVRMVSDDPAKALRTLKGRESLAGKLATILEQPQDCVGLVSSYFVPTRAGTEAFAGLAQANVEVSILTNSIAATDVALVHAGYAHRRKQLLRAGVRLYELCGSEPPGKKGKHGSGPRWSIFGSSAGSGKPLKGGLGTRGGQRPALRSAASVLHAKLFTVDRQRIFVGSFNFDPRSLHLNTELGFVIESPNLAGQVQDMFEKHVAKTAYCLELTADDRIRWIDHRHTPPIHHDVEPQTTLAGRTAIRLLSHMPIEWLL